MGFGARNNIDCLDGIRGFACSLVLLCHAGWAKLFTLYPNAGHIGVMLFFSLSGFLMAYLYMPGNLTWRYWGAFLIRRFFRIYPLFFTVLVIGWLSNRFYPFPIFHIFNTEFVLSSLALSTVKHPFVPAYTIMVEMRFYLFFCLMACGLLLLKRVPPIIWLMVGWAIMIVLRPKLGWITLWPYLCFFLAGVVAAELYKNYLLMYRHVLSDGIALACFATILWVTFSKDHSSILGYNYTLFYQGAFFSVLMATTILSTICSYGFRRWLSTQPMRFLGNISFSLYLTNSFIFWFCYKYIPLDRNWQLYYALVLTFYAAWILHLLIEKPGIILGKKITRYITKT